MEAIQPQFGLGKRTFEDFEEHLDPFNPIVDSDFDFFDSTNVRNEEEFEVKRNSVSSSSSATCISVSDASECSSPPAYLNLNEDNVLCVASSPPPAPIKDDIDTFCESLSEGCLSPPTQVADCNLELKLNGEMESVWYADRPFPRFNIAVTDDLGKTALNVDNWKLSVRVIDGYDQDASDKVYGQIHNYMYDIHGGMASITGLRFCAVSSKAGGHFRIVVTAVNPCSPSDTVPVSSFISEKIQVLSYRLYHAPKVSFDKLKADDSVGKMKGIGSLYAKRFAALGIRTVAQLASIDLSTMGEKARKDLLHNLRKDRGAMTLAKLSGYIQQARDIVSRWTSENQTSKRRRVEETPLNVAPQPRPYSVRVEGRSIRVDGVQFGAFSGAFNAPITCFIKQVV